MPRDDSNMSTSCIFGDGWCERGGGRVWRFKLGLTMSGGKSEVIRLGSMLKAPKSVKNNSRPLFRGEPLVD